MKKTIDWDLILLFLEGKCSETEKKTVLGWAEENEENRKELELITKIWDSPDAPLPEPDVEKALYDVRERISLITGSEKKDSGKIFKVEYPDSKKSFLDYIFYPGFLKAAAAIVILLVGLYFITSTTTTTYTLREIIVDNKKMQEITLADGSIIKLDAGSVFKYPDEFSNSEREVFLNGEGFFDVMPDPQKPFIVHANNAKITVLGTQFNIGAWEKTDRVVVAVAEGKVSLQSEKIIDEKSKVIIEKGQVSIVEGNGLPSTPEQTDVARYISWINREFHFNSVTLSEVLDLLERWYDVEFVLPDESHASDKVTVFIENKPFENILEVISLIMNFEYEIEGNKIIFSVKE